MFLELPHLKFSRNHAVEYGERDRPGRSRRRPADGPWNLRAAPNGSPLPSPNVFGLRPKTAGAQRKRGILVATFPMLGDSKADNINDRNYDVTSNHGPGEGAAVR
jgi:hypothetical protein